MIQQVSNDSDFSLLRGPGLVAWLVANTEQLVVAAAALDVRAVDFGPGVPTERLIDLCKAVRHAALETTVALLALLSQSEGESDRSALGEAIANAHVRIQELNNSASVACSSSNYFAASSSEKKPVISRR